MTSDLDPLPPELRAALMEHPRAKRNLPVCPSPAPPEPFLPLADEARPIDRQIRPIYCVWETTLACDQACRHCGSRAGRERLEELTREERLDVVHQLAALEVPEVTITGGEAYLREDWLDVVREIRAKGMKCSIVTAGKGINSDRARAAKDAGLQSASVSIDGNAAIHDRLRGVKGSYASGVQALANFRDAGIKISVNTQINRLSMPVLPEILEMMIDLGCFAWQIQLTIAMGRAADEPDVLLQPYDVLTLFSMIPALKARATEAGVMIWPGDNIGYFGPHESLLRGTLPHGSWTGCGAGRGVIGLEADGTVKGCTSQPTAHWNGGNIREHSLVEIWERSPQLRYTRDWTVDELWGYCRECYYATVCRGGCTSTSFALFGRAGNMPYCHHRALELKRVGKRERLVAVGEAPGLPMDVAGFELILEDDPDA
ncbi:MAG: radical SAM protein [Deltaproteobacteria bacterium]|nr:radical SAM protein [Deltaproteobacteria bacterium]